MKCPKCHHENTSVIDSRDTEDSSAIRRRRVCVKCEYRFTTFERVRALDLMIKKEDGSHEPYERAKLEKSIWIACGKRPIEDKQIERLIASIEDKLVGETEIKSRKLGRLILKALKDLDDVAYIRYASVYKKFDNIETFKKEIDKID